MDETQKYNMIKKLVDTNGNKRTASLKLGCTLRTVNRMIAGYHKDGKAFFVHGNRKHQPAITIQPDIKQTIVDLYRTKYYECNLTHYSELLETLEHIQVSVSTISSVLRKEFILSPKAHRSSKKAMKKQWKALQNKTKSKKKVAALQRSILDLEEAHPRRPRCAYFGEMLQMDASVHLWFGDTKSQLHIAVDDATGRILGAYFDTQETLNGYYHVLSQVLTEYGIPYQFFTDKRTVFEYKKKNETSVEKDTFTQFGYACKQLGIEIQTSSVAQAKGRVERMFGTLQSRLPVELRLAGVTTLEDANEFLNTYIKKFNAQFALPVHSIKSVFEIQPDWKKINQTLAVLSSRKVDNGCCIKYHNQYYLPVDSNGYPVHYRKGTSGMVIKTMDGTLYFSVGEQVYALALLTEHKPSSQAFDLTKVKEEPKKRYIPPMSHPWKKESFEKYMKTQAHRKDTEVA